MNRTTGSSGSTWDAPCSLATRRPAACCAWPESSERERIARELAALPRPWSELPDQYRLGWGAMFSHATRIVRGGDDG